MVKYGYGDFIAHIGLKGKGGQGDQQSVRDEGHNLLKVNEGAQYYTVSDTAQDVSNLS